LYASATVTALAAAGGAVTAASAATTISFIVPNGGNANQAYLRVISNFEKANPGITVQPQFVPPGNEAQIEVTELRAGNAADVLEIPPGLQGVNGVQLLALSGYLESLAGVIPAQNVIPLARAVVSWRNKLYAWPLGETILGAYYNKAAFQALGLKVPTTFAQLLTLCGQVKAKGKYMFLLAGGTQLFDALTTDVMATSEVYSLDPRWNAKRTAHKVTYATTAGWTTAFREFAQMNQAGCFQPNPTGVTALNYGAVWGQGNILGTIENTGFIGALQQATPTVTFSTFAIPAANAANTRLDATTSQTLGVNAHSPNLAAAEKLVAFFAQPAQQHVWNAVEGGIAPVDAIQHPGLLPAAYQPLKPYFTAGKVMMTGQASMPAGAFVAQQAGAQGLLTGQMTVGAVISSLDTAWNQAIGG
jgi:raffinose/stachyose/melibiose transport system substrate-binding protein